MANKEKIKHSRYDDMIQRVKDNNLSHADKTEIIGLIKASLGYCIDRSFESLEWPDIEDD